MIKVVFSISNVLKFGLILKKILVSLRFSQLKYFCVKFSAITGLWYFCFQKSRENWILKMLRVQTCDLLLTNILWLNTFSWKSSLVNVFQNLMVLSGESCLTGWNFWGLSSICWEIRLRLQAQPVKRGLPSILYICTRNDLSCPFQENLLLWWCLSSSFVSLK